MSIFANSVLVQTGQGSTLQTIGAFHNPRKKRPHFKSRRGCVACKCRRVEALMGAALLINYISWSDVGFLMDDDHDDASKSKRWLRLEQDQLFLTSPGIVRVWFAAVPVFIDEGSVFVQLLTRDTRATVERALVGRGENPERFVEPFMDMWDDELFQVRGGAVERGVGGSTSYAWRFLSGLERDLLPCRGNSANDGGHNEQNGMVYLKGIYSHEIDGPVDVAPRIVNAVSPRIFQIHYPPPVPSFVLRSIAGINYSDRPNYRFVCDRYCATSLWISHSVLWPFCRVGDAEGFAGAGLSIPFLLGSACAPRREVLVGGYEESFDGEGHFERVGGSGN